MRRYLHVNLAEKTVCEETLAGEEIARAGRYFIAKTLVDMNVGQVNPLSPDNPLIFSMGPFAGSNWSSFMVFFMVESVIPVSSPAGCQSINGVFY